MPTRSFTSAAALSLDALAKLFTRAFEGYFYPGITSTQTLARRVATEQIDLGRSLLLRVDGEPAGIALLARRGERMWCGGFGVVAAHRGRGHGHALAAAMVDEAREAGADHLSLEVLTRNTAALRVYEAAGFALQRRLLLVAWRQDEIWSPPDAPDLAEADPAELVLRHYAALHPAPAAWQREPASLLCLHELRGLALRDGGAVVAYALLQGEESARLQDFAARDEATARALIAALQRRFTAISSVNEPAESPLPRAAT
jgi:ribosomal protein S18 acetylase RimI-like enzyme